MATKATDSSSSVGKEMVHQLTTDEAGALARKVCFKFDFILLLPILTVFCEC